MLKKSEINGNIKDVDTTQIKGSMFLDLAYESGKYSRYSQDKNISEEKFKELYQLWVKNSLNKKIADKVFYIKEQEDILGFVTIKIKDKIGQIGLRAIKPRNQGKGFGKNLLIKTENYCLENNVTILLIPTQAENETVCKFYTKMSYTVAEKFLSLISGKMISKIAVYL